MRGAPGRWEIPGAGKLGLRKRGLVKMVCEKSLLDRLMVEVCLRSEIVFTGRISIDPMVPWTDDKMSVASLLFRCIPHRLHEKIDRAGGTVVIPSCDHQIRHLEAFELFGPHHAPPVNGTGIGDRGTVHVHRPAQVVQDARHRQFEEVGHPIHRFIGVQFRAALCPIKPLSDLAEHERTSKSTPHAVRQNLRGHGPVCRMEQKCCRYLGARNRRPPERPDPSVAPGLGHHPLHGVIAVLRIVPAAAGPPF